VTALSDGSFVVTWTSDGQDVSGSGVYGQRYNATGVAQGSEFRVNTYTTNNQFQPAVTALSDGGFVVTWSSSGQDGSNYGVYGQRYNATGVAQGTEFLVNTYTTNNQFQPAVTALSNGEFVVTWSSNGQDEEGGGGVYGQRFSKDGNVAALSFTGDTVVPTAPTINTIATDNKVNATEKTAGVAITGTAEANSTVNITWGATTLAATADNTGAWTKTFTASQVPADAATNTISVTATDAAGNTSTAATKDITVDTVINAPVINTVATDNKVNAAEKTASVTIAGTAEANSTLSITWGATTLAATADNTGAWTQAFTASQVPADAATTISVTATDAAGNSTAATQDITVDTVIDTPTINTVATDNKVNAAEKTAGVIITGTAEANSTVSIAWGATTLAATADNTGAWTKTFTASQVPADAATTTIRTLPSILSPQQSRSPAPKPPSKLAKPRLSPSA
jgi:hypothetical protein